MEKKLLEYKEYVIAFIDILGTKEKTKNDNGDFLNKVHSVVTDTTDFTKYVSEKDILLNGDKVITKIFSDNIVFAIPNNDENICRIMELSTALSQILIAECNCFCRGAITVGNLFIDENIVLGPALNEAYYLESNIAIYPRIVFSDNAINCLKSIYENTMQLNTFENVLKCMKIQQDADKMYILDWIDMMVHDPAEGDFFKTLKTVLRNEIERNQRNPKVLQKLNWVDNRLKLYS